MSSRIDEPRAVMDINEPDHTHTHSITQLDAPRTRRRESLTSAALCLLLCCRRR